MLVNCHKKLEFSAGQPVSHAHLDSKRCKMRQSVSFSFTLLTLLHWSLNTGHPTKPCPVLQCRTVPNGAMVHSLAMYCIYTACVTTSHLSANFRYIIFVLAKRRLVIWSKKSMTVLSHKGTHSKWLLKTSKTWLQFPLLFSASQASSAGCFTVVPGMQESSGWDLHHSFIFIIMIQNCNSYVSSVSVSYTNNTHFLLIPSYSLLF